MIYGGLFDIDSKIIRKDVLDQTINSPDFWNTDNKEMQLKQYNAI